MKKVIIIFNLFSGANHINILVIFLRFSALVCVSSNHEIRQYIISCLFLLFIYYDIVSSFLCY